MQIKRGYLTLFATIFAAVAAAPTDDNTNVNSYKSNKHNVYEACRLAGNGLLTLYSQPRSVIVMNVALQTYHTFDEITDVCVDDDWNWVGKKDCHKSIVENSFQLAWSVFNLKQGGGQHGQNLDGAQNAKRSPTDVYAEMADKLSHVNLKHLSKEDGYYKEIKKELGNFKMTDKVDAVTFNHKVNNQTLTMFAEHDGEGFSLRHLNRSGLAKRDDDGFEYILPQNKGVKILSNSEPVADWDDVAFWFNDGGWDSLEPIWSNYGVVGINLLSGDKHKDGQAIIRTETKGFGDNWETGWNWCFGHNPSQCGGFGQRYTNQCSFEIKQSSGDFAVVKEHDELK